MRSLVTRSVLGIEGGTMSSSTWIGGTAIAYFAAVLVGLTASSASAQKVVAREADETELRQLAQAAVDAANRGDAKAFADQFADDGDILDSFGQTSSGRRSIEQTMQTRFQGP